MLRAQIAVRARRGRGFTEEIMSMMLAAICRATVRRTPSCAAVSQAYLAHVHTLFAITMIHARRLFIKDAATGVFASSYLWQSILFIADAFAYANARQRLIPASVLVPSSSRE